MNDAELPILDDSLNLNLTDLFPPAEDTLSLDKHIEQLSIDLNSQYLKIEIEKLKRQKLKATIKRVQQKSAPIPQVLAQLQNDNAVMREQLSSISNFFASDTARISLITHCCFNRFHQL